jgi:exo-beta-1,3-glucanase (GH17 family)
MRVSDNGMITKLTILSATVFTEQMDQFLDSASRDTVAEVTQVLRGVVVGNEAIFREEITPAELIGVIGQARAALVPLETLIGRKIEVSAADVFIVYLRSQELGMFVDIFLTLTSRRCRLSCA